MKALKATVTILLDPRVIGPEAEGQWGGDAAFAAACDWGSAVFSEANMDTVFDWGYETDWTEVEIDPDNYEEGEAVPWDRT